MKNFQNLKKISMKNCSESHAREELSVKNSGNLLNDNLLDSLESFDQKILAAR